MRTAEICVYTVYEAGTINELQTKYNNKNIENNIQQKVRKLYTRSPNNFVFINAENLDIKYKVVKLLPDQFSV